MAPDIQIAILVRTTGGDRLPFLRRSLESIAAQDHEAQVFVYSDGCSDLSEAFRHRRVEHIGGDQPVGMVGAWFRLRDRVIEEDPYDLILSVDDDDTLVPGSLRPLAEWWVEKSPDLGFAGSFMKQKCVLRRGELFVEEERRAKPTNELFNPFLYGPHPFSGLTLLSDSVIRQMRPDPMMERNGAMGEDWDRFLQAYTYCEAKGLRFEISPVVFYTVSVIVDRRRVSKEQSLKGYLAKSELFTHIYRKYPRRELNDRRLGKLEDIYQHAERSEDVSRWIRETKAQLQFERAILSR